MTTHTDRKSGFGSFPAKGAQPLPTEPVQVHEDPGAAYWKEANDFMDSFDKTHTDRIRQMAQEAGFSLHSFNAIDGDEVMAGEYAITDDLIRFAQLVAEDCARVVDAAMDKEDVCTKDAPSDAIRARYSKEK